MTEHRAPKLIKLRGIPASPGIIIGKARLVDRSRVKILYQVLIQEKQIERELERFKEAVNATKKQIITLKTKMPDQIKGHAFILDTQLMIVNDGMLYNATIDTIINEKINASWAYPTAADRDWGCTSYNPGPRAGRRPPRNHPAA